MEDIYSRMENGDEQRAYNKRRLAELLQTSDERQARIAAVVALSEPALTEHAL